MHIFAFLIIFLMTSATVTFIAKKPSVFQLTSGEYQPYTSETLHHYGIDSRIVMAAFMSVSVEVKTEFYPWARALKWAKRTDRNAYFHYNDPIIEVDPEYLYSLITTQYDWDTKLQDCYQLL